MAEFSLHEADQFKEVLEKGKKVEFEKGDLLIKENAVSENLFIILKGRVYVYKNYGKAKVPLAVLGAGEIVGELAMLSGESRSASVEALGSVIAIKLETKGFRESISPSWLLPVLEVVVARLRSSNLSLSSMKNLNEYATRAFRRDYNSEHLLQEIHRFLRTLQAFLVEKGLVKDGAVLKKSVWFPMLGETLEAVQSQLIDQKQFLRAAGFSGLCDEGGSLNVDRLQDILSFVSKLKEKEEAFLPSLACLRLINEALATVPTADRAKTVVFSKDNPRFQHISFLENAFKDLARVTFVRGEASRVLGLRQASCWIIGLTCALSRPSIFPISMNNLYE